MLKFSFYHSSRHVIISCSSSITMSSSSSYFNPRGRNSWHRGFCSRPSNEENQSNAVSGSGGNYAHGQGCIETYPNPWGGFRSEYRPHPQQQQQFNPHLQQVQFNQYPQQAQFDPHSQQRFNNLYPRQQFNPNKPRPDDHRKWIFAASPPPPHCERFTVLSYNILADYLAQDHRSKLYFHIPRYILDWEWRKKRLFLEFGLWSPDIMCLQEVDRFPDLEEELSQRGYAGIWKMRTGNAVDGCAIFWRTNRFQLRHEEHLEFNTRGLRDNVAQICVLESMNQNQTQTISASSSQSSDQSSGVNQVVVCNIHVLYNPKRGEMKLGQVRLLIDRASAVSKIWDNAPIILCGDFNSTPMSHLYKFISEQKLDISGLARDQISGQYTASLYAPQPYANPGLYRPQRLMDNYTEAKDFKQGNSSIEFEHENLCSKSHNLMGVNRFSGAIKDEIEVSISDGCSGDENREKQSGIPTNTRNSSNQKVNSSSNLNDGSLSVGNSKAIQAANFIQSMLREATPNELISHDLVSSSNNELSHKLKAILLAENTSEANSIASSPSMHENLAVDQAKTVMDNKFDASLEKNMFVEDLLDGISEDLSTCNHSFNKFERTMVEDMHSDNCENTNLKIDNELNEPLSSEECSDPNFFKEFNGTEDTETFKKLYGEGEGKSGKAPYLNIQSSELDSPNSSMEKHFKYNNPYFWTPMEIEAASGNAVCSMVEHSLKLRSAYTDVEDFIGTKGPSREPEVTSYNRLFMGTVDYIWYSEGLQTVKVLDTIPKHILKRTPGFPTRRWGSDHLALVCELAFTKGVRNTN